MIVWTCRLPFGLCHRAPWLGLRRQAGTRGLALHAPEPESSGKTWWRLRTTRGPNRWALYTSRAGHIGGEGLSAPARPPAPTGKPFTTCVCTPVGRRVKPKRESRRGNYRAGDGRGTARPLGRAHGAQLDGPPRLPLRRARLTGSVVSASAAGARRTRCRQDRRAPRAPLPGVDRRRCAERRARAPAPPSAAGPRGMCS